MNKTSRFTYKAPTSHALLRF